jgi:hypothetical protein
MPLERRQDFRLMMLLFGRSAKRLFVPIVIGYTIIAALASLLGRWDFVVYILAAACIGLFVLTLGAFVLRWYFGLILRRSDPLLAETIGFDGRIRWSGFSLMVKADKFHTFLLRRDFLNLKDVKQRIFANILLVLQVLVMGCVGLSVGSFFVLFSIAYSFLPMH